MDAVGQLQKIGVRIERDLRRAGLSAETDAEREGGRGNEIASHDDSHGCSHVYSSLPLEVVVCGRRMIFCARQLVISDTYSSFGLRQSMPCTVLNSFSALPPFPNLPRIRPSSSIL